MWHIATFYRFADFPSYANFSHVWHRQARNRQIKGTLLLAAEGVNGTMAVPNDREPLIEFLSAIVGSVPGLENMGLKWSTAQKEPFRRLKVRLKKEIVTLGIPGTSPHKSGGTYASVDQWNALLSDPQTVVIDTRNDYEVALGSFKGALNPKIASFRDFPTYVEKNLSDKKDRPIAMFCTGGIRCEKASAYMRDQGFDQVYQLEGGILNYLATADRSQTKWQGDCFVFDNRVAVTHDLKPSGHFMCNACRQPLSQADKNDKRFVAGESCPACYGTKSEKALASSRERYRQMILAAKRGEPHFRQD